MLVVRVGFHSQYANVTQTLQTEKMLRVMTLIIINIDSVSTVTIDSNLDCVYDQETILDSFDVSSNNVHASVNHDSYENSLNGIRVTAD